VQSGYERDCLLNNRVTSHEYSDSEWLLLLLWLQLSRQDISKDRDLGKSGDHPFPRMLNHDLGLKHVEVDFEPGEIPVQSREACPFEGEIASQKHVLDFISSFSFVRAGETHRSRIRNLREVSSLQIRVLLREDDSSRRIYNTQIDVAFSVFRGD